MKLIQKKVPITMCTSLCPICNILVDDFPMFESGPGGEFATWISTDTGKIYRIDLNTISYGHATINDCLSLIILHAGSREKLKEIPKEIYCKVCKKYFSATSIHIENETILEVYLVSA